MSTSGLESIDHSAQVAHQWINELDGFFLVWENKAKSYRLLRTVLQTLRDWLPTNELADFAAQLPSLLRGVYYEHWRPATTPVKHRSKADFLARVEHAFVGRPDCLYRRSGVDCIPFSLDEDKRRRNPGRASCPAGRLAGLVARVVEGGLKREQARRGHPAMVKRSSTDVTPATDQAAFSTASR